MKLSARNMLQGKVVDVRKDDVAAQIQIDIGGGNVVTSTITSDSANRLGLENGKAVTVVVKASDVILAVDD
ncbi:MAG: TOBE domain-containing protein [Gammaproteobacteria bacterium]|nr:TOBE domain-containing protein [Gammaproteobacteria bacterium]